ncbi:MAG: hypothetical protein M0R34_07375 [Candidatus Marinimicrobia bacterium]|jgi:hypothetical protein|nr:hypothetical protein [Candidatus Neomarinimicrobiota bacterium]MCK9561014.1 hypothetical protein [Candidatus Neomarinimicrobiota bacterium]MDD5062745.1 hypothetical protein [Candidatus Neomarinimicrobiota bacterium]MDD5231667.1 hypothetical protein [Candidatus Neomarinimicrobiota bacterium]
MNDIFDIIILNGRPASGKSEVIDYLKKTPLEVRRRRFHIGQMDEIDDFPMLWTWFEEDAILEKLMGKPRLHTDKGGYFLWEHLWHLLIERISMDYSKRLRDKPNFHNDYTALVEFSRGSEHGGYQAAYPHLSDDILQRAAIFYIDVPFEESLQKNRKRFNPSRPDSILEHGLPDEKLTRLYKDCDWETFRGQDPEFINIRGYKVPYIVLHNEPDVTTARDENLGRILEDLLNKLWHLRQK